LNTAFNLLLIHLYYFAPNITLSDNLSY